MYIRIMRKNINRPLSKAFYCIIRDSRWLATTIFKRVRADFKGQIEEDRP